MFGFLSLTTDKRSCSEGWYKIRIMIWSAWQWSDTRWNINMEINSWFRNGKQRMMFLVSVMSRHAEDWKVKERNPLEKHSQRSKRGGEKCCCGKITEGWDQMEEAFCEQQLKWPKAQKHQWSFGGTQSPFGNRQLKSIAQVDGNVSMQREENTTPKESLLILTA